MEKHCIAMRMALKKENLTMASAGTDVKPRKLSDAARGGRWECEVVQQLWELVWQFLTMLDIHLTYGPIPGQLPQTNESLRAHTKKSTQIFVAAKPGNKTLGHYAAMKRNRLAHGHAEDSQRPRVE